MSEDRKEGRGGVKAPLSRLPLWAMHGLARVLEYGDQKYDRGNWLHAIGDGPQALEDYQSAALRHLGAMYDDPLAVDPESGLLHVDHAICSLVMLRGIAQQQGVVDQDPKRAPAS